MSDDDIWGDIRADMSDLIRSEGKVFFRPLDPREGNEWDFLGELKEMQAKINALPEPLAYILLDHSMPATGEESYREERDSKGRKFVRCTPAVLDELKTLKGVARPPYSGIPVYKEPPG